MTHAGRAAWSPEIFRPFLTVCLTVFLFEFRPRTFTIGFYGKKRLMVATAGGKKQKGLQRLPARKARFPTSGAQATVDMPRRATIKPTFLQNFLHSSIPTRGKSVGIEQGAPYPLLESHPVFTFPPIPEELVLRKLLRLRVHKSTGDSLLCNQFLKRCAPFLASSITYLFNLSLTTCSFPSAWKLARVIPLYKNRGSQSDPSNYRPISLLPAIGKVMDDIQSSRLLSFLTTNKLISPHQFGFVPRSSTVHQLVYIIDKWTRTRDTGSNFSATFMDFMKAFDRVWHTGLLYKLAQCGISSSSLAWIQDYLSNRYITVQVDGSKSLPKPISAGVPQGSHLGPVLFVVFINDLPFHTKPVTTELYADDALLHQLHPRCEELSLMPLQNAVEAAENWALSWHGRFGCAKTKMITSLQNTFSFQEMIHIENEAKKIVSSHKHLGLILTPDLDWHDHINQLLLSASRRAGLLRWMSEDLKPSTVQQLYIYYLRPKLEYACPVWHGALLERDALALERVQGSVARSILRAPFQASKSVMFEQLTWPSLRWRREILCITLFHLILHTRPPPLDSCLFPFASTNTVRSTRKPKQLILPRARTSRYVKSFFFRSALLWNTLPANLQNITCHRKFKKNIEAHWSAHKYSTKFCLLP